MRYLLEYTSYDRNKGIRTSWMNPYKKEFGKVSLAELNRYLDEEKVPVKRIDPKTIKRFLIKTDRDLDRVEKADLRFPIILIKSGGRITTLIDGNHRLEKCLMNGCKFIKTRTLDLDNAPEKYKMVFKAYQRHHKFRI